MSNSTSIREFIDDTSDAEVLKSLSYALVFGNLDYVNPELSRIAAEKVLEISEDRNILGPVYRRLIHLDMIYGRDHRPMLRKALEEHIIPNYSSHPDRKDREMIRRCAMDAEDLDLLFQSVMGFDQNRRIIPNGQMELMTELVDGYEGVQRVENICRLSNYYAGPVYDRILSKKLEDALSGISYEDFNIPYRTEIHLAIERLTDNDEHEWLFSSIIEGRDYGIDLFMHRYHTVDAEWRGRYRDAYGDLLSRGVNVHRGCTHDRMPMTPEEIMPLDLIDHAMGCHQSLTSKGFEDRRALDYIALDISVACLYVGRYREAYEYAMKSGLDTLCPLICTCLVDGKGVGKDIGLAKELSDRYRSTYKDYDYQHMPAGKRDIMDWYRKRIGEE